MTDYRPRPYEGRPPATTPYRKVAPGPQRTDLADLLERVLDKGIVVAGDIQINLLDIELLTIKIRLLVASVERAQEMGINWWEGDPALSNNARELERENKSLRKRLERLEDRLDLEPDGEEVEEEEDGEDAPPRSRRRVGRVEVEERVDVERPDEGDEEGKSKGRSRSRKGGKG